ncbi:xanthine dehydrogenase small subunit [Pseudahrensia aquimaris]|uniref:Xanthine dehydrogenase small subunit n=1 Tax=Pseudahrensia aquimaris TaxID=744461 RepID=A0ABW3FBR7_9HYPH
MKPIRFSLNGKPVEAQCRADMTVLEWLRGEALLRGTKEGCAEGDCGACSVLVKNSGGKASRYLPTNSCILLMGQMQGATLMTVEGLAELGEAGHAIQNEMAINGASQCGFCTPGIVVALAGLLEAKKAPSESEIHDALAGNLCRCTGYRPIVEAAQKAAKSVAPRLPSAKIADSDHEAGSDESRFLLPTDLKSLLKLKKQHPEAVLLAGGTDLALDVSHARARWPLAIVTRKVEELRGIEKSKTHITFGAAVTWAEMLPMVEKHWPSFATLIRRFGSVQIRSMGTLGGNLGTASPIGDGAPSLLALGAEITLARHGKSRTLPLSDYFTGYRKTLRREDEIIESVSIPLPRKGEDFRVYKISKRYDQDISTVCGAFWVSRKAGKVEQARIAFGGMAAVPARCASAEIALVGTSLDEPAFEAASAAIAASFTPMSDMRGTADYRAKVAANLVCRFAQDLEGDIVEVMAL